MGKRQKKPEFPEENRICGLVFVCQLIAVLSAVSIVYLSVASYMPSIRALNSGLLDTPVMCTTITADDTIENCQWASCGEWCLSKSSGACQQIWVTVRNNGTDVTFNQCTELVDKLCTTDRASYSQRLNCRKDQCKRLEGLFNCTSGICTNMTSSINCTGTLGNPVRCRRELCQNLQGMYKCQSQDKGVCQRMQEPYSCERLCVQMPSRGKNLIILSGDRVVLAKCNSMSDTKSQELIWDVNRSNEVLFISCNEVWNSSSSIMGRDCLNATLVNQELLGDRINYSALIQLYNSKTTRRLPPSFNGIGVPVESELIINNRTKLFINLETCVNSLRDECREFFSIYGRDGRDQRASARFPCFHAPERNDSVVVKFSRQQTIVEFTLTAAVPGCLFIVSCSCLILCTKVVAVGSDAHMHFVCCKKNAGSGDVPDNEAEATIIVNDTQKNNSVAAESKINI